MKILHLIRHAKSSWEDPFQDDFDRPLNERGRRDAPRMARRLKERELHPDMLISSPAERALSTALLIANGIDHASRVQTDNRLYHATDTGILEVIREFNNNNDEVMLFSHNPGLTDFVNRLCSEAVTDNVPTCGIVCIKVPVDRWEDIEWGKGKLVFFDYPRKHHRRGDLFLF